MLHKMVKIILYGTDVIIQCYWATVSITSFIMCSTIYHTTWSNPLIIGITCM